MGDEGERWVEIGRVGTRGGEGGEDEQRVTMKGGKTRNELSYNRMLATSKGKTRADGRAGGEDGESVAGRGSGADWP